MANKRTVTPSIPNDARAARSVQALEEAFLSLLEVKSLDQISIKELTEVAGLSYPTFFRRFASKEELLEHIATAEVHKLLSLGEPAFGHGRPKSAAKMCQYVNSHRRLWTILLTGGGAAAMREEFMRIAREIAVTQPRANPWLPIDLAVPFVTNGIFEIMAWWMRQPTDYPLQNVITLLEALVLNVAGRPRNISLIEPGTQESELSTAQNIAGA